MTDELLTYYQRELQFIRSLGTEFAKTYPKIAGRLRWSGDMSEDPHVSRMIEAFALLNARTRHKLEDEFPEVTEALLGILYPHYLAPMPSVTIAQCHLDKSQAELTSGYPIRRGARIETEPIDGQPCRFRTCYETTVWPIELTSAAYQGQPFTAPRTFVSQDAHAVIKLQLRTLSPKVKFHQFELSKLRVYLHGQGKHIQDLYEIIHNNSLGVAYADPGSPADAQFIRDGIRPVGFERDEGLIDYSARSFLGYRLLTEYFALPEKFMFFDLVGLSKELLGKLGEGNQLDVFIYVDRHREDLESRTQKDIFRLGCTPIVNLYRERAEPIRWTQSESEYRIVPDARRPAAHEIFTVDRVIGTSPSNEEIEFVPFYSTKHGQIDKPRALWHVRRERAGYVDGRVDEGTEIYLSLVNLDFNPAEMGEWTVDVETTCLNRDLASRLFDIGQPKMHFSGEASLAKLTCLIAPTPTLRPELRRGTMWRLISHLSLNHLSLADGQDGAEALREILSLYDLTDSVETKAMIAGLRNVSCRRAVGRVGGSVAAGFCRGVEVTLNLDEERFTGSSMYLFAAVLERFLGLYSSLNSFTQTIVTTTKRSTPLCSWPPRAGEQVLI